MKSGTVLNVAERFVKIRMRIYSLGQRGRNEE
jgi:hypothetical protein